MKKFLILDANALIHRSYYALPRLTDKEGRVVNALYGFARVILKLIKEQKPDYIAATFDRPEPTFRHRAYKKYKATRPPQPQELYDQIPLIKDLLAVLGIKAYEKPGYEADDLMGTLSRAAQEYAKSRAAATSILSTIITGDLDTLQLVETGTEVLAFKKGITETKLYDKEAVKKRYGLTPEQIVDYKAIKGDPSDNIPGVRGIGDKNAAKLLQEFGSLENIYEHIDKCKEKKTECKIKENIVNYLLSGKGRALESKKLVTILRDVPLEFDMTKCEFKEYDREKLIKFFKEFGFKSLVLQSQTDTQQTLFS